jgi:hypothetical protein
LIAVYSSAINKSARSRGANWMAGRPQHNGSAARNYLRDDE